MTDTYAPRARKKPQNRAAERVAIMWTVIYMAQTKESVLKVQALLADANLAVRVRPVGESASDDGYFEILVPETEAQLAHTILIRNGY